MDEIFVTRMPVRFQDIDAAGIVFFARVFDYAHDAFVAYLKHVDLPLDRMLAEATFGIPLVHAEADYKGPLRFGDLVDVRLARPEIGDRSIKLQLSLEVGGSPRAIVRLTHATVDRARMQSIAVPDDWRRKLTGGAS